MFKIFITNIAVYKFMKTVYFFHQFFMLNPRQLETLLDQNLHSIGCQDIVTNDSPTKMTRAGRFEDVDKMLIKYLDQTTEYSIHDVAVSNGVTSLELRKLLCEKKIKFNLHISDKFSAISIFRVNRSCEIYVDSQRDFAGGRTFFGIYGNPDLPNKFFLSRLIGKLFLKLWRERGNAIKENCAVQQINLLHQSVINSMKDNNIEFLQYDVFETSIYQRFDIVRCMNLLNLVYFPDEMLTKGLRLLKDSIKQNGLFIVGKTNLDGVNNAAIYRKIDGKLELVQNIGDGSEISHFISVPTLSD